MPSLACMQRLCVAVTLTSGWRYCAAVGVTLPTAQRRSAEHSVDTADTQHYCSSATCSQPDMLGRPTPLPAGPGQESVWDFPRPSIAQPETATLRVDFNGKTIAETSRG